MSVRCGLRAACAKKHHRRCLYKRRQRERPSHAQRNRGWYDDDSDLRMARRRIKQSQVNQPFAYKSVQRRQC